MIPLQLLVFEKQQGEHREHDQGDDFLGHFELNKGEWPAIFSEPSAIGWHHQAILEECDEPTGEYQSEQAGFLEKFQFVE